MGTSELVARYRDAPTRALRTVPALTYIVLNAAAGVAALVLIRSFDWTFGTNISPGSSQARWTQILIAGFGAMVLFRSSLFVIRVGDQDVAIGPSSFLQIVLGAADRAVDRLRGQNRALTVARVMKDVSFNKANVALPTFCLALMQNLSDEDQKAFARQLAALTTAPMNDYFKSLSLGLAIMNIMGEDVLVSAVNSLAAQIKETAPPSNP